jgi:hypothetical protein
MCLKPLSKTSYLTDNSFINVWYKQYIYWQKHYKINRPIGQYQSNYHSYSPFPVWEVNKKKCHINEWKAHNICNISHSATHKITRCRKQISSINDMSGQVFPLRTFQGDKHSSLTRLRFCLQLTWIQNIKPHQPLKRSLNKRVLFNYDWQQKIHYLPDNLSSQKEH